MKKLWATSSVNYNVDFLYFEKDGLNLVLHGIDRPKLYFHWKTNNSIWKARVATAVQANVLMLHEDGNLVLYDRCNRSIWETNTNGKCLKGLDELIFC